MCVFAKALSELSFCSAWLDVLQTSTFLNRHDTHTQLALASVANSFIKNAYKFPMLTYRASVSRNHGNC